MNKTCTNCNEIKHKSKFSFNKSSNDGAHSHCKECNNKAQNDMRKTRKGLSSRIYTDQISSSKRRKHPRPDYTRNQLFEWIQSQDNFEDLYNGWVKSGYEKMMSPSCDRLDDSIPYTFSNLRMTTWQVNDDKGHKNPSPRRMEKMFKAVSKLTLSNEKIEEYESMSHAQRANRIDKGSISRCCNGILNTAGGFKWEYAKKCPN